MPPMGTWSTAPTLRSSISGRARASARWQTLSARTGSSSTRRRARVSASPSACLPGAAARTPRAKPVVVGTLAAASVSSRCAPVASAIPKPAARPPIPRTPERQSRTSASRDRAPPATEAPITSASRGRTAPDSAAVRGSSPRAPPTSTAPPGPGRDRSASSMAAPPVAATRAGRTAWRQPSTPTGTRGAAPTARRWPTPAATSSSWAAERCGPRASRCNRWPRQRPRRPPSAAAASKPALPPVALGRPGSIAPACVSQPSKS